MQRDEVVVDAPIRINLQEDRFHRHRLIPWWNQELLRDARALVLGAGALGNEIVKNLALLGVGHIRVVDFDIVENSNLSRSILFSSGDEGCPKGEVAAAAARRIFPEADVVGLSTDLIFQLGWGWYLDADVVLTGLDGREARLAANRACLFTRRPFIDGAIEGIDGVARTFTGWNGPCYECTMGEKDWELIRHRRSCNLLSRDAMISGHVPTTSTISSVIAGLQVQQAIKLLHNLDAQPGTGLHIDGVSFQAHSVEYQRHDACFAHETAEHLERRPWRAAETTVADALLEAAQALGGPATVELRSDIVTTRTCHKCDFADEPRAPLLRMKEGAGVCPTCGNALQLETIHSINADSSLAQRRLAELCVPPYDIVRFRRGSTFWNAVLDGDRPASWHRSPQPSARCEEDTRD